MAKHRPPFEVLHFVAKTGFITFELWKDYFFSARSRRAMFFNWRELTRRNYLVAHTNYKISHTLVLNRNEKMVKNLFEGKPAYMPNPNQLHHDEILLKGILWLSQRGLIGDWQTEAELKRQHPQDFRVYVQGQLLKYPDAILYLKQEHSEVAIALEYERTQKNRKRYEHILNAYAGMKSLRAIIWIVQDDAIKNIISKEIANCHFPLDVRPIAFLAEETWKNNPQKLTELLSEILN